MNRWHYIWIGFWLVLFGIMHTPTPKGIRLPHRSDKIIHAGVYFALATLGYLAYQRSGRKISNRWMTQWIVVYALYGVFDEVTQTLVGRTCSALDWLADVAGAAAATLLWGKTKWLVRSPASGSSHEL